MKFNSQICTTKEQSERLLALGLKKETADCQHWAYTQDISGNLIPKKDQIWITRIGTEGPVKEDGFRDESCIPAWSLHRLIEILNVWCLDFNFHEFANAYEQVISYFEERVKGGFVKKEYLEE